MKKIQDVRIAKETARQQSNNIQLKQQLLIRFLVGSQQTYFLDSTSLQKVRLGCVSSQNFCRNFHLELSGSLNFQLNQKKLLISLLFSLNILVSFDEFLSDQGKKFCIRILEELKNEVGFKQITTSAFDPRIKSMNERFNQTFIATHRKHTENWPKYVPFVTIA